MAMAKIGNCQAICMHLNVGMTILPMCPGYSCGHVRPKPKAQWARIGNQFLPTGNPCLAQ